MIEQRDWAVPERKPLIGRYCSLLPLDESHASDLFRLAGVPDGAERYKYLVSSPPDDKDTFDAWFADLLVSPGKVVFVVIDNATGTVEGMQSFMNIATAHGSIEVGAVLWGPQIARSRVCTEALFLFAEYAVSELKYRRFEWKCNNANAASRRAAERFGFQFEGIFRQHMVLNGINRDTAWFSIIDAEWPVLRNSFIDWLDPLNFDSNGVQKRDLRSYRS